MSEKRILEYMAREKPDLDSVSDIYWFFRSRGLEHEKANELASAVAISFGEQRGLSKYPDFYTIPKEQKN